MKSPHEPPVPPEEDVPSEVAGAFRAAPRRLDPPPGTYQRLRRRAAGRRRRRGLALVAVAACCAGVGVVGSVTTRSGGQVVRTRDVAGSPPAASRTSAPQEERSVTPAPTGTRRAAQPTHTAAPPGPRSSAGSGSHPGATPPAQAPDAAPAGCASAQLKLTAGRGAGAAGSVELPLLFTNTGSQACTLYGFPGVSLVGADGAQIGAPATRTGSAGAATVLAPGDSARADLRVTRAENYPQDRCAPAPAQGLRVYPPDRTQALYLPRDGLTGCTNSGVQLLSVRAVRSG